MIKYSLQKNGKGNYPAPIKNRLHFLYICENNPIMLQIYWMFVRAMKRCAKVFYLIGGIAFLGGSKGVQVWRVNFW